MAKQRIVTFVMVMVLSISALSVVPPSVFAAADTCTWGGSTSADWSDGTNWSGCDNGGVPENGDTLTFPAAASNKTMNNDLVGLSVDNIGVGGAGYTIGGNAFTITGVAALDATESLTINADITYTAFNIVMGATTGKTITINGVTNFASGGGEVNVGTTGSYDGTVDFVGNITGSAATQFVAVQGATAIVRGAANTYSAATVGAESNATFECRSSTCFGNVSNDIYMGGGMVALYEAAAYANDWQTSTVTPDTSWLAAYDNVTITGDGIVTDPLGISQDTTGRNLQFTGGITLNGSASLFSADSTANVRIDGTVTGSYAFSIGSGSFRLAGNNSYAGTNTINSGAIVTVTHPSGLGSNAGATNVLSGGSLQFDLSAPDIVDEPILLVGTGVSNNGALANNGESTTLSNTVTLNGNTTVKTNNRFLNFDGVIDGTGDLTLDSLDTNNYASLGATNTYVGTTAVYGAIGLDATGTVPGDLVLIGDAYAYPSTNNTVGGSLTMTPVGVDKPHWDQANPNATTLTSLAGDGTFLVDGAGSSLTINQTATTTFAGSISGNAGPIAKAGAGTLNFNGICSGTGKVFSVNGGTVVYGGGAAANPCSFIVNSGATLKGSGTAGSTTVNNGGTVSVGNSPGCMTFGSLTLAAGATYTQEISGTTACSQFDKATVNGAVDLGGATLQVSQVAGFNPAQNLVFTFIDGTSLTGTFAGLANDAVFAVNGVNYRINYYATGEVTLTVVSNAANATTPTSTLTDTGSSTGLISALSAVIAAVAIGTFAFRRQAFALVRRKK